jgi:hypothetical protein
MWAQGLTIGILIAAGILTHSTREEAAKHVPVDHSWRDLVRPFPHPFAFPRTLANWRENAPTQLEAEEREKRERRVQPIQIDVSRT